MASEFDFSGKLSFLNLGRAAAAARQQLRHRHAAGSSAPHAPKPGVIVIEKGNPIDAANGCLVRPGRACSPSSAGREGRFEFTREPLTGERTIKKGRMEIILDGLRLLDEGKIEKLGRRRRRSRQRADGARRRRALRRPTCRR
ncbi:MAG: DUF4388 domain-containing protein [Desulfobacterales bacterium]|nr:DUF4388 domain-containing protein [Desulfobacterales bacterium]